MSAIPDHRQWVNVIAMLTGHTPEEVEAAYQKVKAEHPEVITDAPALMVKIDAVKS